MAKPMRIVLETWIRKLRERLASLAFQIFIRIASFLIRWWGRQSINWLVRCKFACAVECWKEATGGKPIDFSSDLYRSIEKTVSFYLNRPIYSRASIGWLEGRLLPANFLAWKSTSLTNYEIRQCYRLVLRYRLASIIKNYANIHNFICYRATISFSSLGDSLGEPSGAEYWKDLVRIEKLPKEIRGVQKPEKIYKYVTARIKSIRSDIALQNYRKIDFTISDITGFLTISGSLLVLMGYLRVAIVNKYFGVPYGNYFSLTDYLAVSIASIDWYFCAMLLSVAFAFFNAASVDTAAIRSSIKVVSRSERVHSVVWHVTGISSVAAILAGLYRGHSVDTVALSVACIYAFVPAAGIIAKRFFTDPMKAYLFLSLAMLAVLGAISSSLLEIKRIEHPNEQSNGDSVVVGSQVFSGKEWSIIAVTNSFIILRSASNGTVRVFGRCDRGTLDDLLN
jgi:hypothetical protein